MINLTDSFVKSDVSKDITATVTMKFIDPIKDYVVKLEKSKVYVVAYLTNGVIKYITGQLRFIAPTYNVEEDPKIGKTTVERLKLSFDCSSEYGSNIVDVYTDQLRYIALYFDGINSEEKIINGRTTGALVSGAVECHDLVLENVTIKDGNISLGQIKSGYLVGEGVEGVTFGKTSTSTKNILMMHTISKGNITSGTIKNATLASGTIDPTIGVEVTPGYRTGATIKNAVLNNVVIKNASIATATTTAGKLVDPTIYQGITHGGEVSGDIVTKNCMAITGPDNTIIATGGVTIGGKVTGGITVGYIDGVAVSMAKDSYSSGNIQTTGAVVTGGKVVEGTRVGDIYTNATVVGGVAKGGVTVGMDKTNSTTNSVFKGIVINYDNAISVDPKVTAPPYSGPIPNYLVDNTLIYYNMDF